jgi:hypothetical protein
MLVSAFVFASLSALGLYTERYPRLTAYGITLCLFCGGIS